MKRSSTGRQFAVFVAVGLLCAAVDVGLLTTMTSLGSTPVTATTAGFFAGLVLNFVMHLRVTFAAPWSPAAARRYLTVVAINYGVTVAFVEASVSLLETPLPGKIASLPVIAVNGFLLSKHWVFR